MKRIILILLFLFIGANLFAFNPFKLVGGLFGGKKKTEFNAFKKETTNNYDKLEKQVNDNRNELGVIKENQLKVETRLDTTLKANAQIQADISAINRSFKQTQNAGGNLTNTTNDSEMIKEIFKSQIYLYRYIISGLIAIILFLLKSNVNKNKRLDLKDEKLDNMFYNLIKENDNQIKRTSESNQKLIESLIKK